MPIIQNKINDLLSLGKSEEKTNPYQQKAAKMLSVEELTKKVNPYLDSHGNLVNKYLNYQRLLDDNRVSQKAKTFISQATGLLKTDTPAPVYPETTDAAPASAMPSEKLGYISSKYEVGGWNPGRISSGSGDYGGVSYGIPQFSTKTGSADNFVSWLKKTNPDMGRYFGDSKAGTTAFSNAWGTATSKYGDRFGELQTQYAYDSFVKPLITLAKSKTGVDYTRSPALMELAYSTAIQFGGGGLGLAALGNVTSDMADKDVINASYDKKINNVSSFFKSSSQNVQNSVKNRFSNERNDILSLLGNNNYKAASNLSPGEKVANTASYNNSAKIGQCVWYVRGRMKEKLGKDTGSIGNANQMWNNVKDIAKLPASADSIKPNTLATYATGISASGAKYGHVIYIEDVVGDTVYYTDGGSDYHKNGTDGIIKTASKQGILKGLNSSGSRFGSGLIGIIDVEKV